jgi:signal recognition particle subunit SRP54
MGDILSFIEKAQSAFDAEKAKKLEDKIKQDSFDLNDFLEQMEQMKKVGPLDQFLEMMPGLSGAKQLKDLKVDEKQLKRIEAIIRSMTLEERANPHIINGSRRKRIAAGSGTRIQDVNQLLKSFEQMRKMMKQFGILSKSSKKKKNLFKFLQ